MKILCLSNCILNENLGSGYVILNFAKALREFGHEVVLLDPRDYGFCGEWKRARQYGTAIGMAARMVAAACRRKYDLIEVYGGEGWLGIWVIKKLLRIDIPIASHSNGIESHVNFYEEYWRKRGFDWNPRAWFQPSQSRLYDIGFRNVDALIVVSEFERAYAKNRGYQPENSLLSIENALPEILIGRHCSLSRTNTILYCGAWIKRKNTRLIIQDVASFLRSFQGWSFMMVGSHVNESSKLSFPIYLQERISIMGPVDRNQLIELYQNCAVLVLPSLYESFGLVAAEAMSCGCPVIISRVGLGANLQHMNQAYILDDPVSPNLYKALIELAIDEKLRRSIAVGGHYYVQKLTWKNSGEKLARFYETLVQRYKLHKSKRK